MAQSGPPGVFAGLGQLSEAQVLLKEFQEWVWGAAGSMSPTAWKDVILRYDLDLSGYLSPFEWKRLCADAKINKPYVLQSLLPKVPTIEQVVQLADPNFGKKVVAPRSVEPLASRLKEDLLALFAKEDLDFDVREQQIVQKLPPSYCHHWEYISQIKDPFGSTLLLRAANDGMADVVSHLLAIAKEYEQTVPVHTGTHDGSLAAYVNTPNDMGWTALLLASQNGFLDIVNVLVEQAAGGVHIDHPTRSARLTPLMLAATHGHVQVVQYLLQKNANPWTIAANEQSCLDMVKSARMKLGLRRDNASFDEYRVETADKGEPLAASLDTIRQILFKITRGETLAKLA